MFFSGTEKPVFNPVSLFDINLNNEPGQKYASVTFTDPTATDNSGNAATVTKSHSPGVFDIGTYEVIYTAKDAEGNTAYLSFNITITG